MLYTFALTSLPNTMYAFTANELMYYVLGIFFMMFIHTCTSNNMMLFFVILFIFNELREKKQTCQAFAGKAAKVRQFYEKVKMFQE